MGRHSQPSEFAFLDHENQPFLGHLQTYDCSGKIKIHLIIKIIIPVLFANKNDKNTFRIQNVRRFRSYYCRAFKYGLLRQHILIN